jgi:kynurenine formamidase
MCLPGTIETVRARVEEEGRPVKLDRRTALLGAAGAAVAAAFPGRALAGDDDDQGRRNRLQDLTHEFREGFPGFLGAPSALDRQTAVTIPANGFYGQIWTFWEHNCTHLDVPAHFVTGGRFSPQMSLDELIRPLVVIDISDRAAANPDTELTRDDLRAFERRRGRIRRGAVVAMNSGWAARSSSVAAYRNVGADGLQHFPGFSKAAVEWLLEERDIAGIGVDTLSLDPGRSQTFDAHVTLLGADRYGIENLANLDRVPARGATLTVGLIPWEQGSGGPARVFASW